MTIEEKAKRYDEALEIAKKNYITALDLCEGSQIGVECFKNTLESIFPKLKESEDERILELIKKYIHYNISDMALNADHITREQLEDWLEKQGEKDKLIRELGEYKVKYIQETLGKSLTMNNKDDERVRKTTISFLKDFADKGYENAVECIDWLEKQKYALKSFKDEDVRKFMQYIEKQAKAYEFNLPNRSYDIYAFSKDLLSWIENQGEQKPIDEDKPKFKIGDWITNGEYIWKVISVDYLDYTLQNQWGECVEDTVDYVNKAFHLWTIQDAKDGDVIAFDNGTIVIFKDLYNSTSFHSYCYIECGIFDFNKDELPDWWNGEGFNPSTKEQSDILFQKMKEAGYVWDTDKKELRKEE